MIIMGYPGIGKTTFTRESNERVIDLDSSLFNKDYKQYIRVACDLEQQGYIVFVSSHVEVGEELKTAQEENPNLEVCVCYPVRDLKDRWVDKLKLRYNESKLDKDKRAYKHCEEYFIPDIWYIEEGGYPTFELMPIKSMTYAYWIDDAYNPKDGTRRYRLKVDSI